jgi:hypothetical protein
LVIGLVSCGLCGLLRRRVAEPARSLTVRSAVNGNGIPRMKKNEWKWISNQAIFFGERKFAQEKVTKIKKIKDWPGL